MQVNGRFFKLKTKISQLVLPDSPSASSVPFVEYFKWLRFTYFTPDYPLSIDIQTKSGCNAHCTFCPVGKEENKIYGKMSDDLYHKIIDEALSFPGLRQINPYLLNDPLVDKYMPEKIEYITRKRGAAQKPLVRITTNAGMMYEEMAYKLLHSGLDEINISFHSIIPEVYEAMMPPLKYDRVMGQILKLIELRDNLKIANAPKITIWTVRTKPVEANLVNERAYWKKLNVGFKARKLDNRANSDVENANLSDAPFVPVAMCPIPFWRAWIMWNGDMIMCCVDQERSNLLGNCSTRPIREIWQNPAYQMLRHRWRKKQLAGLLCENCKGT
jgi:MoaA/NifB/PqqE/SkfB family radical SAM enzyme